MTSSIRSAPGSEQRAAVVLGVLREIRAAGVVVVLFGTVSRPWPEIGVAPLHPAVEGLCADEDGVDAEAIEAVDRFLEALVDKRNDGDLDADERVHYASRDRVRFGPIHPQPARCRAERSAILVRLAAPVCA